MREKTIVLGAGVAGLAYAYFNKDLEDICVYEKEDYYGGLCHSFKIQGFTFDSAVHLSFTNDKRVRDIFDKVPYITHKPVSYNFYNGYWLKHPIINNTYPLSVEEKTQCITSFFERKCITPINNYEDWLKRTYGEVFTKKFYDVYTEKYWTMKANQMSTIWLGDRFTSPDPTHILRGSYESNDRIDYYAKEMRYPESGKGYQEFLEPMIEAADIKLEMPAVELDLENKRVTFLDGEKQQYTKLVSSIPLPELVKITRDVPSEIVEAAAKLKASKVSIVSIGFNKPDIARYLWFYIYDKDILAARVNSPSKKCTNNVPMGCSSLQFEIYHAPNEVIKKDVIIENVRYALAKMQICKEEDIEFMDYRLLQYGNVIFELEMEKSRYLVKKYYENAGVKLIGRFGQWEYLWSDQSLLTALR